MKVSDLVRWCFLFPSLSVAMPGRIWRRQAQTSSDTCTCPANAPITTTVSQFNTIVSYSTLTIVANTVYSTDLPSTSVVTVSSSSTITVTIGTSTLIDAGITTTTTTLSTTTSTITATITETSCVPSAVPKVKRQTNSAPSSISTNIIAGTKSARCVCRLLTPSSGLAGASTSTCLCPATGTTITSTIGFTATTTVLLVATTQTTITVTPSATSTSMVMVTVTSSARANTETTQQSSTVTSESIITVYTTTTSTAFTCPPTTTSSSSSTSTSGSSSSTEISTRTSSSTTAATSALATGQALTCNSTAYLIATTNAIPKLYNIDLRTSAYFPVNNDVGAGRYNTINGLGYNVLDNYLYGIGQINNGSNYDILRISSTGYTKRIGGFTDTSTTFPASSGDVDTAGNFWIAGSGGTTWRQVNVVPDSSTYGQVIGSGTMTLTGFAVYDWVYLPGNGSYMYSLATSVPASGTSTTNSYLAMLRWSLTSHTWSTYAEYTDKSGTSGIIANWGSVNGTVWGMASNTGTTNRVVLGGQPVNIGSAPKGISSADGARCVLSTT